VDKDQGTKVPTAVYPPHQQNPLAFVFKPDRTAIVRTLQVTEKIELYRF
jgi:hypothetical protein